MFKIEGFLFRVNLSHNSEVHWYTKKRTCLNNKIQKQKIYKYKQTVHLKTKKKADNYLQNNKWNRHKIWKLQIICTLLQNPQENWSPLLHFLFSSFALRLVADGGSDLTLDVLFLAVDDEAQRRVHSYTSEVKRLPDRGNVRVRLFRKTLFFTVWTAHMKHWPRLYVLCCFVWAAVQEWLQCLLSGRPSCPLCCIPSPLYMTPRCRPCQTYWKKKRNTPKM